MNLDSFIAILGMFGSGNNHFRISISNLKQRRAFSLKCFLPGNVVADLNIKLLATSLSNKVDFLLIKLADINIISTAKKLDAYDVFIYSAIIHISADVYKRQDQIGPVGKDVSDCAALLEIIAGHDTKDSTSMKREDLQFSKELTGDIKGMKFGVPEEYLAEGLDPEVKASFMGVLDTLKELGEMCIRDRMITEFRLL